MGSLCTQTSLAAVLQALDPVQAGTMEQRDENQNDCTKGQRRQGFEFIRDLIQECRNRAPQSPVSRRTRSYKLWVWRTLCTTVDFDRCRTIGRARRRMGVPRV